MPGLVAIAAAVVVIVVVALRVAVAFRVFRLLFGSYLRWRERNFSIAVRFSFDFVDDYSLALLSSVSLTPPLSLFSLSTVRCASSQRTKKIGVECVKGFWPYTQSD